MDGKTRSGILLLLAFSLLVSGCAGSAKNTNQRASDATIAKAGAFDNADVAESGELVGRVVDDEFRPLGDVLVRLLGTPAETTTTQDGIFYFARVPARTYTISYSKSGFETKNQSVLVRAQERVVAEALLAKIADTTPFLDAGFTFRGRINCSARGNVSGINSNPECGQLQAETDINRMRYIDLLGGVRWLLIEVSWLPSIPVVNDKLTLAVRPCECPSWRQLQGASPIKFMMGPTEFGQLRNFSQKDYPRFGGQLQLAMFPGEVVNQQGVAAGATAQQDFTIYATVFYRMDPEPGYTRLPKS